MVADKMDISKKNNNSWISPVLILACAFFYGLLVTKFTFNSFIFIAPAGVGCLYALLKRFNVKTGVAWLTCFSLMALSPVITYGSTWACNSFFLFPLLMLAAFATYSLGIYAYFIPAIVLCAISVFDATGLFWVYIAVYILIMLVYACRTKSFAILKLLANIGIVAAFLLFTKGFEVFTNPLGVFPLSDILLNTREISPLTFFEGFIVPEFWLKLGGGHIYLGFALIGFCAFIIYAAVIKFCFIKYEFRAYKYIVFAALIAFAAVGIGTWIAWGINGGAVFGFLAKLCISSLIPALALLLLLFPRENIRDFDEKIYNTAMTAALVALILIVGSFWIDLPLSLFYGPLLCFVSGIVISKLSNGFNSLKVRGSGFCVIMFFSALGIINNILCA